MPIQIVPPDTRIDFIGKWKLCVLGSVLLLLVGVAAVGVRGIHWGIDFAGGTEVQIRFEPGVAVDEGPIRAVVAESGVQDPSVVRYGQGDRPEFLIRFRGKQKGGKGEIVDRIAAAIGDKIAPVEVERVEYVGPRVGAELRRKGLSALGISCLLILIYIAFRFTPRFAPGAVIALLHDVLITSGVWVLLGKEFNLQVLAALLAILGYSLNDTIIVYDRIRENIGLHTTADLPDVLNRSVNQTLSRTLLTSGTTLLALIALLVVGGEVIEPFALAMTIGIVVGTYSSVYIASPTLLLLERRVAAKQEAKASPPPAKRKRKKARAARARG